MRFPDAKMVQVYSSFKSLGLRITNAQIVVEPWNSGVGAKGELQQAWFRVRGIPNDQRSVKTVAKVGGLVGKTMIIDEKTRTKGDYVRMRIACRDAKKVPASVEGTLGLKIFDFFFEREVLYEEQPDEAKIGVQADEPSGQPNPKRVRTSGEKEGSTTEDPTHKATNETPKGTSDNQKHHKHISSSAPMKLNVVQTKMANKETEKSPSTCDPMVFSSGDSEETDDSEDFSDKLARINAQYNEGETSQADQCWFMRCEANDILDKLKQEALKKKLDVLAMAGLTPEVESLYKQLEQGDSITINQLDGDMTSGTPGDGCQGLINKH
ncbi:unnamed protein product [Urochloa humidicola]